MKNSLKTSLIFALTLLGFIFSLMTYSLILIFVGLVWQITILLFFMFLELALMFRLMRIHDIEILNGN
jgi:hypothetical protein